MKWGMSSGPACHSAQPLCKADPSLNAAANAREGAVQQRWPKPHATCRMLSRMRTCAHGRGEGARLAQQRQAGPHTVVRAEVVCR